MSVAPRTLILLAPFAVGLLYWLGRPGPPAVAAAPLVVDAGAEAAESAPSDAAADGAAADDEVSADTASDRGGAALQVLADGGFVVDLNRATEQDLRRLSGIGPGRARAILALRQKLGRFKAVDDLLRIKGFGKATLRRLRPQLKV